MGAVRLTKSRAQNSSTLTDLSAELALIGDWEAWQAAEATSHDLLARLAVVPLVLEARGLDVTPTMIARLDRLGDTGSAAVLRRIYDDEIGHVATGMRWFAYLCARGALPPAEMYHALVRRYFKGVLKPPFNDEGRAAAGFSAVFYAPLAAD